MKRRAPMRPVEDGTGLTSCLAPAVEQGSSRRGDRQQGFTLIEILLVIAIIGILMALLFPGVRTVMRAGQKANAARTVAGLAHAFRTYHHERSVWPNLVSGQTDSTAVGFLTGQNLAVNPQRTRYMELPPKRLNAAGELADPWGSLYRFRFDTTYSQQVTGPNGQNIGTDCIVWSPGPDWLDDTRDDIKSW